MEVTTWKDEEQVYCQFVSCEVKNAFLEQIMTEGFSPLLKEALIKPDEKGETFTRKPWARSERNRVDWTGLGEIGPEWRRVDESRFDERIRC